MAGLHVLVIGGGIGGLCLAHGLKQAGISVAVYERDTPTPTSDEGYSIQINNWGHHALHDCLPPQVWDAYRRIMGPPVTGLRFVTEKMHSLLSVDWGAPTDPVDGDCRVSRVALLQILRSGLEAELHYARKLVRYARTADKVEAFFADGSTATGDVLVGADGVGSVVRRQLLPQAHVRNLDIVGIGGRCRLDDETRPWLAPELTQRMNVVLPPAGCGMFVTSFMRTSDAVALKDHVFWALIARFSELDDVQRGDAKAFASGTVDNWHPLFRQMVAETEPCAVTAIPLQTATPVAGWQTSNVTLLGDAIHTMTPLQGLGANTALRDASVLCHALTRVNAGQSGLLPALRDYEVAMRLYAFAAVRQSLQQTEMFVSNNRFARTAFKAVLRTAAVFPPLKRRLFHPPAE